MTHDRGPWGWQEFGKGNWCLTGQYGMRPIVLAAARARTNGLTSLMNGLLKPFIPDHPNSKLIAAAPELLEACKVARNTLKHSSPGELNPMMREILEIVNAAIAKAGG